MHKLTGVRRSPQVCYRRRSAVSADDLLPAGVCCKPSGSVHSWNMTRLRKGEVSPFIVQPASPGWPLPMRASSCFAVRCRTGRPTCARISTCSLGHFVSCRVDRQGDAKTCGVLPSPKNGMRAHGRGRESNPRVRATTQPSTGPIARSPTRATSTHCPQGYACNQRRV